MYNNFESDYTEIKCGVPQGSVLGPLLFMIYINDLPSVSKLFMPIRFADDTNQIIIECWENKFYVMHT